MFLAFPSISGVALTPPQMLPNPTATVPVLSTSHCRFCAQEKYHTELLDLATNVETKNHLITILKFLKIDFVDLFNSKIPNTTCYICYNEIIKCYNFFVTVMESQKILKQFYCNEDEQDETMIKIEPVDCLDVGINNEGIKQESNMENGTFSQSIELEISSDKLQQSCAPDASTFEAEKPQADQKFTIPIECKLDSAITIKKNNTKSKLKSKLEYKQNLTVTHTEVPCFESNSTFVKTEVNNDDITPEDLNKTKTNVKQKKNKTNNSSKPLTYGSIPVFVNELNTEVSWTSYLWRCKHCQLKFDTMQELRNHSMQMHKRCFAFECAECSEGFNMFHPFIEHLRRHKESLRFYCPHCNKNFGTVADCTMHVLDYWRRGYKFCNWCGEKCPSAEALNVHKSMSQQVRMPRREARKVPRVVLSVSKHSDDGTWDDYEWGCLECALSFKSVAELRMHSQSVHDKCFAMRCADCLAVKYNYPLFTKHVIAHRPYLREYCPYCNKRFEDANELEKHTENHLTGTQRACYGCGQIFQDKNEEKQHMERFNPKRTQKYLTTEDLTCQVCKKIHNSVASLRKHKKTHDKTRKKEHFCHLCGKQFIAKNNLKTHMMLHDAKKMYECKVCNKSFVLERYLINHVMTHNQERPFVCNYCSKGFIRKDVLISHINTKHNNLQITKKYKCTFCPKRFRASCFLKIHLNVHTGATPYQCQNCEKSFTNWANCNKHMMRIHGTTLATTKLTERGRIPIGEEMPEITSNVKEWMAEVTKSKKGKRN